ncbi:MAG: AAA domain-containing protein [Bacteroidota bacterium]
MEEFHPHLTKLIDLVQLESKQQEDRFASINSANFKQLKHEGYVLHPIKITRKSYGYADYPEISFVVLFPTESNAFRNGASIQLFIGNEEPVKGILLFLEGSKGEIRLFASDFPDWVEERGVGIQLTADQRTNKIMLQALKSINENSAKQKLFSNLHEKQAFSAPSAIVELNRPFQNQKINDSQKNAIKNCLQQHEIQIIHGPPGTGKTTTITELIYQLHLDKKRILVAAPSNTAVDHLGLQLAKNRTPFLRVGNNSKVNEALFGFTMEGKMEESKLKSTIKNLRIQSEQLRKMSHQYKRNFGKSERDQRKLLLQEVKNIRTEIKALQSAFEEVQFEQNSIIIGTPIGIYDCNFEANSFDVLIIDEAGQCLEPIAWTILDKADKIVLAGDPFQLPPTVISFEAEKQGLSISILERVLKNNHHTHFLDTQYRMTSLIAEYSNNYFYEGKLKTAVQSAEKEDAIFFYDTAGADYSETLNEESFSIVNEAELNFIPKLVDHYQLDLSKTAFITPYSGQLQKAKEMLGNFARISTIDSFQGQEEETIILSLVRSNSDQNIGFLADYRRMNVALTRAKKKLFIIGDSTTIGSDSFYSGLISFIESKDGYHSVWELDF